MRKEAHYCEPFTILVTCECTRFRIRLNTFDKEALYKTKCLQCGERFFSDEEVAVFTVLGFEP